MWLSSLKEEFKKQWPLLNDWDEIADWWLDKIGQMIDDLESNPITHARQTGEWTLQYWIEAKQRQLRDKYL